MGKRYASLDFIRGVAMLGVLLFHVLNVAYDASAVEDFEAPIPLLVLGVILIYFGMFNGLFVLISGLVNVITMDGQWKHLTGEKGLDDATAAKKIFAGQCVRGGFTWLMGALSEWILNGIVVDAILGEEITWLDFTENFFTINILQAIGLCTIISSALYLWWRKAHLATRDVVKRLVILAIVVLVARVGVMAWIELGNDGQYSFWDGRETRTTGQNLLYGLLAPWFGRLTPLIPFLAISFAGTALGAELVEGGLTKRFLKRTLLVGAMLCLAALGATVVELLVLDRFDFDNSRLMGSFLSAFGGELIATALLLYLIDYRGKTEAFSQNRVVIFFRRIALVTLTLWNLQWIMIVPLFLFDAVTGWGAVEGALNGYQLLFLLGLITLFWWAILRLWERVDYKFSFEWLANKVIGATREKKSDRLKVRQILYDEDAARDEDAGKARPAN